MKVENLLRERTPFHRADGSITWVRSAIVLLVSFGVGLAYVAIHNLSLRPFLHP